MESMSWEKIENDEKNGNSTKMATTTTTNGKKEGEEEELKSGTETEAE